MEGKARSPREARRTEIVFSARHSRRRPTTTTTTTPADTTATTTTTIITATTTCNRASRKHITKHEKHEAATKPEEI